MSDVRAASGLGEFADRHGFHTKGPLCVALVVTRKARSLGLPLDPDALLTERGGQVMGLGRGAVQSILSEHGIERVLAKEGGRTSRGSIDNMRTYVDFLNSLSDDELHFDAIEEFWIRRVKDYFSSKPLIFRSNPSYSLRWSIQDLLKQAVQRQRESPGTKYAGAVLQHLVGAKIECVADGPKVEHFGYSTSDEQRGRAGDFVIGDVAIHVTTAPTEAVIVRCRENIEAGFRPLLVTTPRGVAAAEVLAENQGLGGHVDVFEIEQFLAVNILELGRFDPGGRRDAVADIIGRYNSIVDRVETDPSIKIQMA